MEDSLFDNVLAASDFETRAKDICRSVIKLGLSQRRTALNFGVSQPYVCQTIKRFRNIQARGEERLSLRASLMRWLELCTAADDGAVLQPSQLAEAYLAWPEAIDVSHWRISTELMAGLPGLIRARVSNQNVYVGRRLGAPPEEEI